MSEWQPIDTAPDDVEVLIYGNNDRSHAPCVATATRSSFSSDWNLSSCEYYLDIGAEYTEFVGADPTHWMPLPEGPK